MPTITIAPTNILFDGLKSICTERICYQLCSQAAKQFESLDLGEETEQTEDQIMFIYKQS